MTDLIHAVDVSVYSGNITPSKWQNAIAKGFSLAVVGSWHGRSGNRFAHDSLKAAREAGMQTASYVVLNGMAGNEAVKRGMDACRDEWQHCAFVALDVELTGFTEAILHDAFGELEHQCMKSCCYTGAWFWEGKLDNPTWASALGIPLWSAHYGIQPSLTMAKPYGGWYSLVGHQFQGSNNRLGFSADLSVFDSDWLSS